jgi:RNA polymerase sigma-70 factor (ECF subfamily)
MSQAIDLAAADVDLLASLRRGDVGALKALAERYGSMIYRLAFGVTRNQADAEEVLQDVLLTLARKGGSFEGRSALGSWIYRITTNAALNKRRGKRLELETSLEELLPTFKADGHRAGDRTYLLADWSQNPEEEFLSGERRRVLELAIDSLPEHYRVVLVLRDVEELSNEEVAALLEESVASVKSRLHRARMVLREQLTRVFAGSPVAPGRIVTSAPGGPEAGGTQR